MSSVGGGRWHGFFFFLTCSDKANIFATFKNPLKELCSPRVNSSLAGPSALQGILPVGVSGKQPPATLCWSAVTTGLRSGAWERKGRTQRGAGVGDPAAEGG